MKIRLAVLIAVASAALFACPETRQSEKETPVEKKYASLREAHGGYVRGPSSDRVIVFVNGVFGDAVKTWEAPNGSFWPDLLASDPDFAGADIYVHSFDSPKLTAAQNIDELARRMEDYLHKDGVFEKHRQVIFLCHSMGGLVTRAFLLKERPSPEQVPMIYFFATPTNGANVAGLAHVVSSNPQLDSMRALGEQGYVGNLVEAWLETSKDSSLNYPNRIASFCAYEKKDTFPGVRIVPWSSAISLCNHDTRGVLADHIEIVKPTDSKSSDPYVFFKAAYDRTVGATAAVVATALLSAEAPAAPNLVHTVEVTRPASSMAKENLSVKQTRLATSSITARCGETKEGDITATIELAPGEEVLEVRPAIENATNLFRTSVAVVRHERNSAVIRYSIEGASQGLAHPAADVVSPGGTPSAHLRAASRRPNPSGLSDAVSARVTTETVSSHLTAPSSSAVEAIPSRAPAAITSSLVGKISALPEAAMQFRTLRVTPPREAVSRCPGDGHADVVVSFVVAGGK